MIALTQPMQYLIVTLLVTLSGSIIPFVFSAKYTVFLILFLFLLLLFFVVTRVKNVNVDSLAYLLTIVVSLLLLLHCHDDFDRLSEYYGFIGRFSIAFLVTELVQREKFVKIYTDIIVSYSVVSLILYFVGIFSPQFISSLPVSYNDAGTGYRHIFFYFYQGIDHWNFRNAGIFWEAGAYQVFLSMALIFEVYFLRRSMLRVGCLFAAIATTISSVGIMVLLIVGTVLLFLQRSLVKYPIFILLALWVWFSGIIDTFILVKFYGDNISGIDRLAGQMADLQLFSTDPFIGVGMNAYNERFKDVAYSFGAIKPTSSNSFTGMLALNGALYSLVFFLPMFAFFVKTPLGAWKKLVMLAVFILLLSSQGVMMQIFFLCIAFYSFHPIPCHESAYLPSRCRNVSGIFNNKCHSSL